MMEHIVSFSGGRTSAYLVYLMEQKRKNDGWSVHYIFMDTGAEHPKTYKFVKDIVNHWGIDLVCLRAVVNEKKGVGTDYAVVDINDIGWDLSTFTDMVQKYSNPSINAPHCTRELKYQIYQKYIKQFNETTTWLGIRVDEKRRLKGKKGVRYLAEISSMRKSEITGWWSQQDFDLEIDDHLGNCVFCVKKGTPKIALAQMDEPEKFKEWSLMLKKARTSPWSDGKHSDDAVYRGYMSPESVAKAYADYDRSELSKVIFRSKMYDTGSCTESCEVFSDQMDLFEDVDL